MKNSVSIFKFMFIVVSIAGMFFFSCSKEKNNATIEKQSMVEKYNKYFSTLGENHNKVLDFVGSQGDMSTMSRKDRFELASEFTGSSFEWSEFEEAGDKLAVLAGSQSIKASDHLLVRKDQYSPELIDLINKLDIIIKNELKKAEQHIELSPSAYNASIDALINEVYNNYDVQLSVDAQTGNEFAMFIAQCNVSKSSFAYWHEAAINPENPWYGYVSKSCPGFWERLWRAVKIVAIDTFAFMSAPICGDGGQGGYDLICAWGWAGDQSSSVD